MRIERPELDAALDAFARGGHGLVLGRPGVGKSYTLAGLARRFEAAQTPYLLVTVDELGDVSEDEVRLALGYPGTFREALADLVASGPAGAVVFDGFDATRNAGARARLLQLIRTAVRHAPPTWSVLVSVRSYDAAKSPALLDLFRRGGPAPPAAYQLIGVPARHFAIPELSDDEASVAAAGLPNFAAVYARASDGLRRLARVPFNLWLIERVLRATSPDAVTAVASETQLLELYWASHVTATPDADLRATILRRATSRMVDERRLSVRKAGVYTPDVDAAWQLLLSAEVLTENGPAQERVSFTHNILFDYAASVLVVPDLPADLSTFLRADPSRPLFLRPSLVYLVTRLWYAERAAFWRTFWHLLAVDDVAVRLVGRLIPPAVVVAEASAESDLAPLLDDRSVAPGLRAAGVLRTLQALRFVDARTSATWVAAAPRFAEIADPAFAWELATFLTRTSEPTAGDGRVAEASEQAAAVGRAARTLFDWAWANRVPDHEAWYDAFASMQALPLVLTTFGTDVPAGRAIVRRVLSLLGEAAFPIRYFSAVADGISEVIAHAPDLAADVYRIMFGHSEQSDAPTHLGGIVLRMQSTRRQDFEMTHYALAQAYPEFLRVAPEHAVAAGCDVVNHDALEVHTRPYLREGKTLEDLATTFQFSGAPRRFVEDFSSGWRSGRDRYADKLYDALRAALGSADVRIEAPRAVAIVADHTAAASGWALLLEVGAAAPASYAEPLFELALAPPIQLGGATLRPLGAFIECAAELWSAPQRAELERSIFALGEMAPAHADPGRDAAVDQDLDLDAPESSYAERVRDRLLARIPRVLLVTPAARARVDALAARDALPDNSPLVEVSTWTSAYSADDWLEDQGADLTSDANAPLLRARDAAQTFGEAWRNAQPSEADIGAFLPTFRSAFDALRDARRTGAGDVPVSEHAWAKLAASAHAIAKARPSRESEAYALTRAALLDAAAFPAPEYDAQADRDYTSPHWSPSPRTEAAEGLAWLASVDGDTEVAAAAAAFARSPSPAERFLAVTHAQLYSKSAADTFWALIEDRVAREENRVVADGVLDALATVRSAAPDRALVCVRAMITRWLQVAPDESDLPRSIANWLVYLAVWQDDAWAWAVMRSCLADRSGGRDVLPHLVFFAVRVVNSAASAAEDPSAVARATGWLLEVLEAARASVAAHRAEQNPGPNAMARWHTLVERIATHLRLALRPADEDGDARPQRRVPTAEDRHRYAHLVWPLLDAILIFADAAGGLAASTAHHIMELLNALLDADPAGAVHVAARVAVASSGQAYHLDSLAVREVVRLVETVLTDHRDRVSAGQPLADMLQLLDVFADAGWPEALRLAWRLDEVFR